MDAHGTMDFGYPFNAAHGSYGNFGGLPTPSNSTSISDNFPSTPVREHLSTSNAEPLSVLTPVQDTSFDISYDSLYNTQHTFPSSMPKTPHPHKPSLEPQHYEQQLRLRINPAANNPTGSNSDDEDMTPAQSRRKAQNRAAQRAFRERKEKHVRDLEKKLADLQKDSASINEENERLKLQLQKAVTENEILKITSSNPNRSDSEPLPNAGPMRYSPSDFCSPRSHDPKQPSHRIVTSESGEKLYAAGAAWDYIIKHPLYERGLVDIGDVSDRLKRAAKCDGQGPVFEEREIIDAIKKSVASGNDELL